MSVQLSAIENEMQKFDFKNLAAQTETAKVSIANAQTVGDIKAEICNIWSKIGKYVKLAEAFPFVGEVYHYFSRITGFNLRVK